MARDISGITNEQRHRLDKYWDEMEENARRFKMSTQSSPAWQPIETAPEDGTCILATGFDHGDPSKDRHYDVVTYKDGWWVASNDWDIIHDYLTHWMPLPEPPK